MPKITISCPFCGNSHTIFASVSSYICDQCNNLLLLNKTKPISPLFIAQCPICQSQWASSEELGNTRCNSCGVNVRIENSKVLLASQSINCTACGSKIYEGMYLCMSCEALHADRAKDQLGEYSKTDSAFTKMFSKLPEVNKWGYDAITQNYISEFGFYVKGIWLLKYLTESLPQNAENFTTEFKNMLQSLAIASTYKHRFSNTAFASKLDNLLILYYKYVLNDDFTFKLDFDSKTSIESWRGRYAIMNKLYEAIINCNATHDKTLRTIWPVPIIDLVFDKTKASNNSIVYLAKAQNTDQIRQFISWQLSPVPPA